MTLLHAVEPNGGDTGGGEPISAAVARDRLVIDCLENAAV